MTLEQKYLFRGTFVVKLTGRKATNKNGCSVSVLYECESVAESIICKWYKWASMDELTLIQTIEADKK
jgi:hypothetical protein